MMRLRLLIGVGILAVIGAIAYLLARPSGGIAPRQAVVPDATPGSPGKQVFDRWCAECHGRGPGHPGTQSLEVKYQGKVPGALEDRTDLSPEVTAHFVRNGVALMPFFRKTEISDADLQELADYLEKK
jgi:mono/diheme cytochrome c family protein